MKSIGKKDFVNTIVKEYSCSPDVEELGKAKCTMELFVDEDDETSLEIVWDMEFEDGSEDEVVIGIWTDDDDHRKVIDYDGVFELPEEAIKLLEDKGFDTTEVRFEED